MGEREAKAASGSEGPQERAQAKESTYVVMMATENGWLDMATVTVPAKSKRKTIIAKALEDAGTPKDRKPPSLRVLDEKSAHVTTVEWEQPPPQLRIG